VGCIYSAQGFEFDYCAVILGNDLVWRDGVGWVANRDASEDSKIRRRKFLPDELKTLLWHTYRVLLTRGMKGTLVYSTDFETLRMLQSLTGESDTTPQDDNSWRSPMPNGAGGGRLPERSGRRPSRKTGSSR
jgi:DUF2075 family protein